MKTYGKLWMENGEWRMRCDPHVAVMAKRIFQRIPTSASGIYSFENTPSVARDLEWFIQRYPLEVVELPNLVALSRLHQDNIASLNQLIDPRYHPPAVNLKTPARHYQLIVPAVLDLTKGLLLGDEVGLGKTCSAICSLVNESRLPGLVVCPAHLPAQWEREVRKFMPDLRTHIIKTKKLYELPKFMGKGPDLLICSYFKLNEWQEVFKAYCRFVIFDECQELRRDESVKYTAAKNVADVMQFRLGLSATPVYNYGGEIFNVLDVLTPGQLGTREEFYREWCTGFEDKKMLVDPLGFGSWMREQHIMLRRTRSDVGRDLPELSEITHTVEADSGVLKRIQGKAGELARILMAKTDVANVDKMQAAGEFDLLLRQATGISKAPYVAEFVKMIAGSGEKVVLFGWHRAVYEIWLQELAEFNPVMYTGSENPSQKAHSAERFINGDSQVLIVSNRSGSGLDGLQKVCSTVVIGELDWSPAVLHQGIGRVHRDGQEKPVQVFYLVSEDGADPFMSEVIGLKRSQQEGINGENELKQVSQSEGIKSMAKKYLSKFGSAA